MSIAPASATQTIITTVRDSAGRKHEFHHAPTTYIDPTVVIDEPERVRIGADCVLEAGVVLRPQGGRIVIGQSCSLQAYSVLTGTGGIFLGDACTVGPHCVLHAQQPTIDSLTSPIARQALSGAGIYLMGDNHLGPNTVLCDDVTLGRGAVIQPGATVTQSVPMICIAGGNPAEVLEKRCAGPWDFKRTERGTWSEEMPEINRNWIHARGSCIARRLRPDDEVLEVGCGEGIITSLLSEFCRSIVGCDYSQEALQRARAAAPQLEFHYANVTHLRFPDASFTAVVMSDVAEHLLREQLLATLDEIRRVLQPGGHLLLATPLTGGGPATSTYSHIYEYSPEELEAILRARFEDVVFCDGQFGLFDATI